RRAGGADARRRWSAGSATRSGGDRAAGTIAPAARRSDRRPAARFRVDAPAHRAPLDQRQPRRQNIAVDGCRLSHLHLVACDDVAADGAEHRHRTGGDVRANVSVGADHQRVMAHVDAALDAPVDGHILGTGQLSLEHYGFANPRLRAPLFSRSTRLILRLDIWSHRLGHDPILGGRGTLVQTRDYRPRTRDSFASVLNLRAAPAAGPRATHGRRAPGLP